MIAIYEKPDAKCFGYEQTKKTFIAAGAKFEFIDIIEPANQVARDYVVNNLGYMRAPVVVVSDDDHWSGLDPVNIERVIGEHTAAS